MTAVVSGRPVLVAGLGVSGASAAAALLRAGADVLAVDGGGGTAVEERAAVLARAGAQTRTGVGPLGPDLLAGRDLVVPSPGLPEGSPLLEEAHRRGVAVWSEPELAWRLRSGETRLVAVTGTNGKTSTVELLAAALRAPAAGNIGAPLSDLLTGDAPPSLAVAELSSFQLRFCEALAPAVAVLLNVAPDHLDWHGSLAGYRAAKARIWQAQGADGWTVLNADDPGALAAAAAFPPPGKVVRFTLGEPGDREVGFSGGRLVSRLGAEAVSIGAPGRGSRPSFQDANLAAAAAAALCAGAAVADVSGAIGTHRPGPNRLETVADVDGVVWVNDSKATNPHAAAAALSSFRSVVWIAGGLNKGLDFGDLAPLLRERVRAAVTIGSAGPEIARLTRELGIPTREAGELAAAVRAAAGVAVAGDVVLLAPACASMDQFSDYAARGDAFRRAVHALHESAQVSNGH